MAKYVIACIDNDIEILDSLYNKISRIVDSDYIVKSYISSEQALIGCYNYIIAGNEILITILGNDNSNLGTYDTSGYAYGVSLSSDGTKAYVAADTSGLQIIDLMVFNP